ncbi:MAG: YceI family protein [Planctomycetota bacterium]
MRIAISFCLGLSFACSTFAADNLTLDSAGSKIEFVGTKPGGKHDGGFKEFKGKAVADHQNPSSSTISIEIDAKSLWSDNSKLTNHLKNADFFDVRKFPKITFQSTKVAMSDDGGTANITGNWTMLGKEVEIEIPAKVKMTSDGMMMTADFTIDRTKWGMNYGQGKVDNDVKVKASLALKR